MPYSNNMFFNKSKTRFSNIISYPAAYIQPPTSAKKTTLIISNISDIIFYATFTIFNKEFRFKLFNKKSLQKALYSNLFLYIIKLIAIAAYIAYKRKAAIIVSAALYIAAYTALTLLKLYNKPIIN